MADAIYHFAWGTFCDWYVELIKGAFDDETKRVAAWVFDQILVMLHPFMPFVTEELWTAMGERPYELIVAKWPEPEAQRRSRTPSAEIDWLIELVIARSARCAPSSTSRGARSWSRIVHRRRRRDGRAASTGQRRDAGADGQARRGRVGARRCSARIGADRRRRRRPSPSRSTSAIDLEPRRRGSTKAAAAAEKERDSLAARLANPNFTERAKPEAVEKARADHAEKAAEAERYRAALERLG